MSFDPIPGLTPQQKAKVAELEQKFNRDEILTRLKTDLQTAVEVELSTLPIYLYTYYSINRQPGTGVDSLDLFANKAGGTIMSVAVEEMLHMSLAANVLFALGEQPKMYGKSPDFQSIPGGGTNLPHHNPLGPDGKPMDINLAGLNYDTLWGFLEIEYPKAPGSTLADNDWTTIGELYSFIRCLIATKYITDADFKVGSVKKQISDDYYAQNCIDTIYPDGSFKPAAVPPASGSAAKSAQFPNSGDSHGGYAHSPNNDKELNKVHNRKSAVQAIETICDQGEGYVNPLTHQSEATDDPAKTELSHYYKFLSLQAALTPYGTAAEKLPNVPKPPGKAPMQVTPEGLAQICFKYPTNPTTAAYPAQFHDLSNLCNGVYQYLFLMTEATFTVSGATQVELFNVGVHKAMIWVLDKLIQGMHTFTTTTTTQCATNPKVACALAPTFENLDITSNGITAKENVLSYCASIKAKAAAESDNQKAQANSYSKQWAMLQANNIAELIRELPNVEMLDNGQGQIVPVEVKHACMGLNECKGQGREIDGVSNNCAGQGLCYTSNNHTCHTLNNCKNQGGCGLYGTSEEQKMPGDNACKGHGSCATPINAERFATAQGVQRASVWQLARETFERRMTTQNKAFGDAPSEAYQTVGELSVAVGPSYEWIKENGCVTACGSSGMSGAGSCGG